MNSTTLVSQREALEIVGAEMSDALYEIDRTHLHYGEHWRYNGQQVVYTLAGMKGFAEAFMDRAKRDLPRATHYSRAALALIVRVTALEAEAHARAILVEQSKATPSRSLLPPGRKSSAPYYRQGQLA